MPEDPEPVTKQWLDTIRREHLSDGIVLTDTAGRITPPEIVSRCSWRPESPETAISSAIRRRSSSGFPLGNVSCRTTLAHMRG